MKIRFGGLVAISTLFCCAASCATAEDRAELCGELRRMLDAPSRDQLNRYQLERTTPLGGTEADEQYFNVDIDGDDISDYLASGCPRSAMPADPCAVWVKLTSGGKFEHVFGQEDFFSLFRLHSQVYILIDRDSPSATPGDRSVLRIGSTGIEPVCPNI